MTKYKNTIDLLTVQGLKFTEFQYSQDTKNLVLDTKLWMTYIPTGY
jgi:hypothetical protein